MRGSGRILLALAVAVPAVSAQQPVLEEQVEVSRVLVDLRAVDPENGEPVLGLGTDDFRVWVDGEEIRVTSVVWIPPPVAATDADLPPRIDVPADTGTLPGRRIVLFFQRHLHPSRILGLMELREEAKRFVGGLAPEDRVAIFMHDWKLRLYSDFTVDHDRVIEILDGSIVEYRPPPEAGRTDPDPAGITAHYDESAAERAATPEKGIRVVARALGKIPGPKSLVYLGWGMGRMDGDMVSMRPEYASTLKELVGSRTAVFALDVTQADFHTLELPLARLAIETGGLYAKTFPFPALALDRLAHAIAGHYELAFEKPDLPPGTHRIRVRLRGKTGVLYHRELYEG